MPSEFREDPRILARQVSFWRQFIRRQGLRWLGHLYSRPKTPSGTPGSLLLIRPDHLGDMLFLTPALHALRGALPGTQITVLGGPWSQGILRDNPDCDLFRSCRFPAFDRQPKESFWSPYRLLREAAAELRSEHYDTAVVLRYDHWWGAWLAAAAGIPRRIGYDWPETRSFLTQAIPYRAEKHEVERNAALLAIVALLAESRMGPTRFGVTVEDQAWADGWLAHHGASHGRLVAIHPGAGASVKQWPAAAWAGVADCLAQDLGVQILLTGSAMERSLNGAVARLMVHQAFDAAGETTLGQLAALQAHCALVMGSDSGPLHLAVALDVPTVHLYGPVSVARFGPWGRPERHVVIGTDWTCAPCNRLDWPARSLAAHGCMGAIPLETVCTAAKRLLEETSTGEE